MQDAPNTRELLAAVQQFLTTELAPTLTDPRLRFRTLVAANVLTILGRELDLGQAQLVQEQERLVALLGSGAFPADLRTDVDCMTRELAQKIRNGDADDNPFHDAVFAHVEQTITEKLTIANPKYLERVLKESGKENSKLDSRL